MKERLVGAAVLVLLVVIAVPALLSGPRESAPPAEAVAEPAGLAGEVRVVEIDLAGKREPTGAVSVHDPVEDPAASSPPGLEASSGTAPADGAAVVAAQAEVPDAPPEARTSPVAEGPAVPAGAWAVQVAALSSGDAAARLATDLKGKGYSSFVLEHRTDGRVFYRVRVGPESRRERAEALAARLEGEGLKATVVAHP